MVKYAFEIMGNSNLDIVTKLFFTTQNICKDLFIYFLLALIFIVTFWVTLKKTQDLAKTSLTSFNILFFSTVLLYYWGIKGDYSGLTGGTFVSDATIFIISIAYGLTLILAYFIRKNQV